jgi:DNA-binding transcriptional LysR family regulator
MDLWQLQIFCKVIDTQSFSKAGDAVHLTQPTVSSHIKELENHFGCILIDRLGKKAVPTKAGELLYVYGRKLLKLRDETESALSEFQGSMKGRLFIGGSTIPGGYILPRIIGLFTKTYPEVTVSLAIADTAQIVQDIIEGRIELGLVGARSDSKRVVQQKLTSDELALILPSDHPLAGGPAPNHNRTHKPAQTQTRNRDTAASRQPVDLALIKTEPFIIRERGSGTLQSIQLSLAAMGADLDDFNIVAEMGDTNAVIQSIKSRVGISILSKIAVAEELAAGTLTARPIAGLNLSRSVYLTRHRHRSPSPLGQTFFTFLTDQFHNGVPCQPNP